jgi:hypothetical protein
MSCEREENQNRIIGIGMTQGIKIGLSLKNEVKKKNGRSGQK